jgi:hypothetical protein
MSTYWCMCSGAMISSVQTIQYPLISFLPMVLGHLPICSRILSVDTMLKSRVWVLRGDCAKECKSEGFEASSYEVCWFVPAKQDGRWAHFLVKFMDASLTHLYNPIFV